MKYQDVKTEYNTTQKPCIFKKVWASIEPTTGKEYMEAQRIRNELTYKIIMRYTEGITSNMLLRYRDKTFKIISIINDMEKNQTLQLVCIEEIGVSYG